MHPLVGIAVALGVLFVATWAVSVPLRNASIVDTVWGLGFAVAAITSLATAPVVRARHVVTAALVIIWGVRLAVHIGLRNKGKGEDFRYVAMRAHSGDAFWWKSLPRVFLVQAVVAWIVALPVGLAASDAHAGARDTLVVLGAAVWLVGFGFESIGDLQLRRFKADPANRGRVMDRGLWARTRHPNYFGDAVMWWGVFLTCIARPRGWFGIAGPLLMTFLLVRVSGVALLEKSLRAGKPDYAAYMARTPAFFPRVRRRRGS